jgi:methyl-accepting chemotaxis protein
MEPGAMKKISLDNMPMAKRMALVFGAVVVLIVLMAVVVWKQLGSIDQSTTDAAAEASKMHLIQDLGDNFDNEYLQLYRMSTSTTVADKRAAKSAYENLDVAVADELAQLKAVAKTQTGKDLLATLETALAGADELQQQVIVSAMAAPGFDEAALVLLTGDGMAYLHSTVDPAVEAIITWRQTRIDAAEASASDTFNLSVIMLLVGTLILAAGSTGLGVLLTRSVTRPIAIVTTDLAEVARGNLTGSIPAGILDRKDEMGTLARDLQATKASLRGLIGNITQGVGTLASSATQLSAVSAQTAQSVGTMTQRTSTVAAAAEEASANTASVAGGMEQASTNLASVASATEEMSATIGEIAASSEKARAISTAAGAQAASVTALMQQLGAAATEIGQVTETITDISSQTNLLALNATIEAARAGAAGKGFAVVANEIKELARQTASATEDIKTRVGGVQTSASAAIGDIGKITGVISEVGGLVASIATAIEEQAAVTRDVARNIARASAGVREANDRVTETASVSRSMAMEIAGVDSASREIRHGGEQVEQSAHELSRLAEQLHGLVAQFSV